MMRIKTVAGLAIAGAAAAAAIAGGVAYATADEGEPVVRIVTEEQPPAGEEPRDCPEKGGGESPATAGTGL